MVRPNFQINLPAFSLHRWWFYSALASHTIKPVPPPFARACAVVVISAHLHRTRLSQYLHLNLLALARSWWFTSHLYRTRFRYYTPCPLRIIRVFAAKYNVREGQKTATPACGPNIYEWKGWYVMFKIPMHNFDPAGPRLGASLKIDDMGQKSRTTWKWPNICTNIGDV